MWETPGQCFVLTALHRLPSHSFVFTFCFPSCNFFSMTAFKKEIISQSVLTWLKILAILFFCAISEMQKVFLVLQACNFFKSCSMESNLVADWWWTVWFDILFTFRQLLILHPCCRIRGTKCVQRTTALYQYKLFNLFPFSVIEFCEVVMFKPWTQYVWSKSGILFFFARHAQPPLGLWLRTLQCKWTLSIWFLLDHNAVRFSLHLAECLKEIQKTNVVWLFFIYLLFAARIRFSLVYLCV